MSRLRVSGQLSGAVRSHWFLGFLAPLAHQLVFLVARLLVCLAWRESPRQDPDLRQPDVDDADRRSMARGLVGLRRLGWFARDLLSRRALVSWFASNRNDRRTTRRAWCVAHVPARLHYVGVLSCRR